MTARGAVMPATLTTAILHLSFSSLLRAVTEFLSSRTRTWTFAIVMYVWHDTATSRGKGVNHLSSTDIASASSRERCSRYRAIFAKRSSEDDRAMTRKYSTRPSPYLSSEMERKKKRNGVTTVFSDDNDVIRSRIRRLINFAERETIKERLW